MRFFCVIMTLLCVVLAGCSGWDDLTKDDVSDVEDCYEQTIIVDGHYAIVLDKDCMDLALLSAGPKIALEAEAIEKAVEAPEPEVEAPEPEDLPQYEYDCPISDLGDWTLLTTLERNNSGLDSFRVPDEEIDPITQAYVDQKDFLFVIYQPAVIVDPRWNRGYERAGGSAVEARYYLEAPGLLEGTVLSGYSRVFHFVDPDAHWFTHYDQHRDKSESGFTVTFSSAPVLNPEDWLNPRKFLWSPTFGTSLDGFFVGGAGAPDINQEYVLSIYIR